MALSAWDACDCDLDEFCEGCRPMPFDPTKPVQTRGGQPARIICTDRNGEKPVVALVRINNNGNEGVYHYTAEGRWFTIPRMVGQDHNFDLVNVPEDNRAFITVYKTGVGGTYRTLERARELSSKGKICFILELVTSPKDGSLVSTHQHPPTEE